MGVLRQRRQSPSSWVGAVVFFVFFVTSSPERDKMCAGATASQIAGHRRREGRDHDMGETRGDLGVRGMVGPGSSPPTCRSKCGMCEPCRPVHVPIHPGRVSTPLEYYPEAWRCKCGNTLFIP